MGQWFRGNRSTAERRRHKFEKQAGRCWWCGAAMTLTLRPNGTVPKSFATFEHLVRRADGGAGLANNVVLACRVCNNERHGTETAASEMPTEGAGWALV